jgi:hypothetical protein
MNLQIRVVVVVSIVEELFACSKLERVTDSESANLKCAFVSKRNKAKPMQARKGIERTMIKKFDRLVVYS